jgi:prevent-host-death family protein
LTTEVFLTSLTSQIWSRNEPSSASLVAPRGQAKFSEVVRRAQTKGPQTVTVHGKEAVTISKALPDGQAAQNEMSALEALRALDLGARVEFELPARPTGGVFRDVDLP